jgi:hypothetical protein
MHTARVYILIVFSYILLLSTSSALNRPFTTYVVPFTSIA